MLPLGGQQAYAHPSIGIYYYNQIFGNVHQNPSRYSNTLTTIACGHPMKVYKVSSKKGTTIHLDWREVRVGPYLGFMRTEFLDARRPKCFQDKYPKYFDLFEPSLAEIFYWGRLYDQYVRGRSKVR